MSTENNTSTIVDPIEEAKAKIVMPVEPKKISLKAIAEDVSNGLTRLTDDPNYNPELGSIQSKYELTVSQVKELFKHSSLKGLRVKVVKSPDFEIIEDLEEPIKKTSESAFGKPSAATLRELEASKNNTEEVKTESVDIPF